ncbi:hypothetical protein C8A03DRAFT_38916 [Achaetomium macrosporum]|uniref:non-specific serine/threonine protein kinase n=1 Tax=Achaetomium macrosporum TaxID=79813 RepID=A0AAN7C1K2_9PEZI|nr:hypothetical protein C8A03DRAFT_38916 [Achaetomium macrosporum]
MSVGDDPIEDSRLHVDVDLKDQNHIVYHIRNPNSRAEIDRREATETWQRVKDGYLGAGGFGTVYKEECTQNIRNHEVGSYRAVKVIPKYRPGRDPNDVEDTKAAYKQELKALAKFSSPAYHDWFVKSFGWYEWAESIYITMEYIERGDLSRFLDKPFSEDDTREIASQVIKGLGYMHRYGYIHRDLKPQNLLVVTSKPPENKWWIKISDFGITKQAADGVDSYSTAIGTHGYAAPEVCLKQGNAEYTRKADMWSVGAICAHLMTGKLPFDLESLTDYYLKAGPFTPDQALSSCNISADGRDFVHKLMAKNADSRPTAMRAPEHPWMSLGSSLQSHNAPKKPAGPSSQPCWPTSYCEPANVYNATAQWDSEIFVGQQPVNEATIRPTTPARPAPSSNTAIYNPQNEPATPHAFGNSAGGISFPVVNKPPEPEPPAINNAVSYKDLARQQRELFRGPGPSLSKKERRKQRQEHALREFHGNPPSPGQDVVMVMDERSKGRGADWREEVEVMDNDEQEDIHAQRAREAKEMERRQRELFLNAGLVIRPRKEWMGEARAAGYNVAEGGGDGGGGDGGGDGGWGDGGWGDGGWGDCGGDGGGDGNCSDGDSDWSDAIQDSGGDVVMIESSKPAAAWQSPEVHDIKEMEHQQRELFLNAEPARKKRAKNIKEAERRQREPVPNTGLGKERKERRRAGQDIDNIKELERQQRELFLNAGPARMDNIKELKGQQRELFPNAGPGKKKRSNKVKEAERRQREPVPNTGLGKERKEQRRAGQDIDNIKELERQQRELFLNAGPGRRKARSLQSGHFLHLALFVPWEEYQGEPTDDVPGLWRSLERQLGARIRSHVRNIALLRVLADDACADRKLQGLEEEPEDLVDAVDFGDQAGDEDGVEANVEAIDLQDHFEAFLDVLFAVRGSEIRAMAATSALRRLDEEARAVDLRQDDSAAAQRGRHFYTMLQHLQDSPFRGVGLPSREEIDAVLKVQEKEDSIVTANPRGDEEPADAIGPGGEMRLELGPYATYVDVALGPTRHWTLNKLHSMAVLLPAAFLDERGTRLQEEHGKQHLQYVGGEGGTGKSRVIHAIKDMFRLKDGLHTLLLMGAGGNADALIGGVTLHSAANIPFEGRAATTTRSDTSKEAPARKHS